MIIAQSGGGVPNPFKSANPFQQAQQHQQPQQQQQQPIATIPLNWTNTEQPTNNSLFSSTSQTNGYGSNLIKTNIGNGVSYATNGYYTANQQQVSPYQNQMKTMFGNPFMVSIENFILKLKKQ